jgi:hypothetical protein
MPSKLAALRSSLPVVEVSAEWEILAVLSCNTGTKENPERRLLKESD